MAIVPISALVSSASAADDPFGAQWVAGIGGAAGAANPAVGSTPAVAETNGGDGFGDAITKALENVNSSQLRADALAEQAATGELTSVSDYMTASAEAQLVTQLAVAVRNRAVEAFNEIMRMQV